MYGPGNFASYKRKNLARGSKPRRDRETQKRKNPRRALGPCGDCNAKELLLCGLSLPLVVSDDNEITNGLGLRLLIVVLVKTIDQIGDGLPPLGNGTRW